MKPEAKSQHLLSITKAKAKMWEYNVPYEHHITIPEPPDRLFPLSIALLGDIAAEINRGHENTENFKELNKHLRFAADFFYSFYEAKLLETVSPRLRLFASVAFYLCDMPGNAMVLAKSIQYENLSADTEGLDALLLWILQNDITTRVWSYEGYYKKYILELPPKFAKFYQNGDSSKIENQTMELRKQTYETGTDEQLLLGDLIAATTSRKIRNSSIQLLQRYSDISIEDWKPVLQKESFIREFWPAQQLLGEKGVFKGHSVVVQMPTSAGKTKSIELVLRSAFLSQRTNLAIIVAPFRALCHEIKNALQFTFKGENVGVDALSDVLQRDFENLLSELFGTKHEQTKPQVLVVTPEKLLYVLRHHPELAANLKLVVFDEGHQFDTGKRGITYELLLTSLKRYIPNDTQKILISAVIPNADEIAQWLNGDTNVAQRTELSPTEKSIGFASWRDALGQIKYVEKETDVFFVPRVIQSQPLQKKGKERNLRYFPEKNAGQDISLFLGLKLCSNGGVAIFCGRKDTAFNVCKRLIEVVERSYDVGTLTQCSDADELMALSSLCAENLGETSIEAQSARIGILAHHNNIPHGIRIAVEYAMREDKIRFLVCTSTLAQGVNLPIRYLLVTSFYQGQELIKVRDFHNLIGRAGRAGKHIEGSILFAEPEVYDKKDNRQENWRWKNAQKLLDVNQSERVVSSLLELFEPIHNNQHIRKEPRTISFGEDTQSFEAVIDSYINNQVHQLASNISARFENSGFDFNTVFLQLFHKQQLLESIENFLLAHWENITENPEEKASELAQQTLAYHLADDEKKGQIVEVFQLLAMNISEKIPEPERKQIFGKTLYGIYSALKVEEWVKDNRTDLLTIRDRTTFFEKIWPLFCDVIESNANKNIFSKFSPVDARKPILFAWLDGKSFAELLETLKQNGVKKTRGKGTTFFTVEDMVDLCENTFAFDGMLVVGAIIEFLSVFEDFDDSMKEQFQFFQKQLKYGLPTLSSILVYELGFADRVIAQKIAAEMPVESNDRQTAIKFLQENHFDFVDTLPDYYKMLYISLKDQ
jgi:replicative superfamily II helicase